MGKGEREKTEKEDGGLYSSDCFVTKVKKKLECVVRYGVMMVSKFRVYLRSCVRHKTDDNDLHRQRVEGKATHVSNSMQRNAQSDGVLITFNGWKLSSLRDMPVLVTTPTYIF